MQGDEAVVCLGKAVGFTTSGCFSPLLGRALAIASIPPLLATPGSTLQVTSQYILVYKSAKAFCEHFFFIIILLNCSFFI